MSAIGTANWYHCSIEPMSRSDGRSAVAAAAYRFGMSLHDERYAVTHDYSRKRGVECAFMVAPAMRRSGRTTRNASGTKPSERRNG